MVPRPFLVARTHCAVQQLCARGDAAGAEGHVDGDAHPIARVYPMVWRFGAAARTQTVLHCADELFHTVVAFLSLAPLADAICPKGNCPCSRTIGDSAFGLRSGKGKVISVKSEFVTVDGVCCDNTAISGGCPGPTTTMIESHGFQKEISSSLDANFIGDLVGLSGGFSIKSTESWTDTRSTTLPSYMCTAPNYCTREARQYHVRYQWCHGTSNKIGCTNCLSCDCVGDAYFLDIKDMNYPKTKRCPKFSNVSTIPAFV